MTRRYYPRLADADSIIALRYGPDNTLVDSLSQTASRAIQGTQRAGMTSTIVALIRRDARELSRLCKSQDRWRLARRGVESGYRVIGDDVGNYFAKTWCGRRFDQRHAGIADTTDDSDREAARMPARCSVFESTSQTAIQGVFVRALNATETATAAIGETRLQRKTDLALDAASYHLLPYLTGYSFGSCPSCNGDNGGGNDTIWANRFDPGSPPAASLCRVYGYVQTLGAGGLEEVVVTARIAKTPAAIQWCRGVAIRSLDQDRFDRLLVS